MSHSLDFHAGLVAPRQRHALDRTRGNPRLHLRREERGIWFYHYSTAPMSMHIANGMFGAVIIDPTDLDKVDREYVMVALRRSTWARTAPRRRPRSLSALQPNAMAFNGVPSSEAHPIHIKPTSACVWVMDAGPNLATTFHVVGTQFDTVWREGAHVIGAAAAAASWGSGVASRGR